MAKIIQRISDVDCNITGLAKSDFLSIAQNLLHCLCNEKSLDGNTLESPIFESATAAIANPAASEKHSRYGASHN